MIIAYLENKVCEIQQYVVDMYPEGYYEHEPNDSVWIVPQTYNESLCPKD
jgi:hypothetical protein